MMGIHRAAVSCAYPCRTNTDVANFQTLAAVLVKVKAWFVEAVARCPGTRQVPRNSRTETMLNTPMRTTATAAAGCLAAIPPPGAWERPGLAQGQQVALTLPRPKVAQRRAADRLRAQCPVRHAAPSRRWARWGPAARPLPPGLAAPYYRAVQARVVPAVHWCRSVLGSPPPQ